jgi:hypothetical protein
MILKAHVAHHIPGRLRLKIPDLKGNAFGLGKLQRSISSVPSVTMVEINALTGSVLVRYRCGEWEKLLLELSRVELDETIFEMNEKSAANYNAPKSFLSGKNGNSGASQNSSSLFRATVLSPMNRASSNSQQSSPVASSPIRKVAGRLLLILGVAGVLLPVVPGTPFLLAGVAVAGVDDPLIRRTRGWIDSVRGRLGQRGAGEPA